MSFRKITRYIIVALNIVAIGFLFGCATMEPIKRNHDGELKTIFNKYRNVLNQHEWEIQKSDSDGGFLKATKAQTSIGIVVGIFSINVSCSDGDKINCLTKISRCNTPIERKNQAALPKLV